MNKHTQGPWRLRSDALIVGNGALNMSIAIAYDKSSAADGVSRDEMLANARLIAAAPAMLEALEDMYNESCGYYKAKSCGHEFTCICLAKKALAAIKQARGES